MRKIVFMMSVSLDGYFEGPDHDLGWRPFAKGVVMLRYERPCPS